ncbi:MAG: glycosyltransferase family 39 protein [Acidobacteria bacterium]|nr:glycosyltransferase family 39 protein [Acidobacteriota bacterium]
MSRRLALAVVAACLLLFAWNTWGYDLWTPDEPYFAEGAREMIVDGHWAVPHVNGVVTTDKPPLFFWLIALLSLPFGHVSSLTARLPSVLASAASIALTMRLGRRMGGERLALLAAAILATTVLFWEKSRTSQIDALLSLLVLVAVSAFEAFRAGDLDGRRAGLLFWAAAGLAVLAKGPVGLLLPLGVALVTLAWDRRLREWRGFAPLLGPLAFVAVLAPWLLWAGVGHADEYSLFGAFQSHVVSRAVHGMHHAQPPYYFLGTLPMHLLPWTLLLPGALVLAWRARARPADRLLLVFGGFIFVFFTAFTEKRGQYLLPAFPAYALLFARLVDEVARPAPGRHVSPRWVTVPQYVIAFALALAAVVGPGLAWMEHPLLFPRSVLVGVLALCGAVAIVFATLRRGPLGAAAATAVSFAAVYLAVATLLLPALDPVKSFREMSQGIARFTETARRDGARVLAFRLGNLPEAFALYSDGMYVDETASPKKLRAHLANPPGLAVLQRQDYEELPDEVRSATSILARWSTHDTTVVLIGAAGAPGPGS